MAFDKEKYIGEAKIKDKPSKALSFKLKEKSVLSRHLSEELSRELGKIDDLQHQIESLVAGSSVPITNEFGDSEWLVISQKAITDFANRIWGKLEEITGESYKGFSLVVTPEYYIGEDGCTVNIYADSASAVGKFEYIKFYIDDMLVTEGTDVETLQYTTEINGSVRVKCVAKILGIEYTEEKIIANYNSFFVGAAKNYTSIMNVAHTVALDNMKASCNIAANDGDRIFIVVGKSLRDWFTRADMNGIEIPFTESEVKVDGKYYFVFTSVGTYELDNYNIDINS